MKTNTKKTLSIYWAHCLKYRWMTYLMVVCSAFAAGLDVILPLYSKDFINILAQGALERSQLVSHLINILLIIVIIQSVKWLLWRFVAISSVKLESSVMSDLSNYCYRYIHRHSFSFFINNFAGALVKKLKWFVGTFEGICDNVIWKFVPLLVSVVVSFFLLLHINYYLGFGMLVWVIIFLVANWIFIKYKLPFDIARSESETRNTGLLSDTISNSLNLKLFNGYGREIALYADSNEDVRQRRLRAWNMSVFFHGVQGILAIVLEFGLNFYAIQLWQRGGLTIGDFVLIQGILISLFMRIWDIGRVLQKTYESLSDAEEMAVILQTEHEIEDMPNAKALKISSGQIEFRSVGFNYNETREILKDFNLTIKPRERIALIGSSGAGKTTITKLLLLMHDLTSGQIMIDEQNISAVTQESLWQNISLVPQEPILFHRTLLDNIRYGKPEATDEEVYAAAKAARCHDFIMSFPEGYQTFVGERGVKLSGGERQRVAIARAILRNAPILILDEATSSLDSESERQIQEALAELMKDKTVIVVAHRLSTIRQMDRILVIENGQVVEEGTHDSLTNKTGGIYNKLWQLQAGGFVQ